MSEASEDPAQRGDLVGERCGGSYTITALLGEGGMGLVYRAVSDMLAGREAAVKVLHHEMTRRPEALARFRAEVYAAGRITDPNIVRVFDAGSLGDGRLYMLMEYCGGGSLASLLEKQGPLSFELAVTIIAPILGSPGYMAPEQCAGRGIDHRADIYALGALLYEAVTGRRPYPSDNLYELITSTVQGAPFPRPSELRRDLPPAWDAIILACLARSRRATTS